MPAGKFYLNELPSASFRCILPGCPQGTAMLFHLQKLMIWPSPLVACTYIFFLITTCGFSQIVEGKVVEHSTKSPIGYVNIGILNSPIGTISNEDGTFSIRIPPAHGGDSLTFSMLGYERLVMAQQLID